jgi:hypothetical protein
MKHLVNTIWERSRCGLSDSWLVVLNDGGAGAEPVRPKSVRVFRDVCSDRRGRPRTAAVPEKNVRVLGDVGSDRRGRPRTAAVPEKSVRVLGDVGSDRRGGRGRPRSQRRPFVC